MEEARTKVVRHESERGSWELVLREPDPRLRGFVQRYGGYTELGTPRPVLQQEVPSVDVPLILNFDAGWQVADSAGSEAPERRTSFVAGLFESSVYVAAEDAASCVQVHFTPRSASLPGSADERAHEPRRRHGGRARARIHDTDYGSRDYIVRDPEGNLWSFGTYRPA
jgi:hypothetical protein